MQRREAAKRAAECVLLCACVLVSQQKRLKSASERTVTKQLTSG